MMSKQYTEKELNKCSKTTLISLFLSMQDQMEQMNHNLDLLVEQMKIANQKQFGRTSEKVIAEELIEGQLNLFNVNGSS